MSIEQPGHDLSGGKEVVFAHFPVLENRLPSLREKTQLSGVPLSTRKRSKDRDILTTPALLHHNAGPLGHLTQEDGEVSFEFSNGDRFHVGKFTGTGQVVKFIALELMGG